MRWTTLNPSEFWFRDEPHRQKVRIRMRLSHMALSTLMVLAAGGAFAQKVHVQFEKALISRDSRPTRGLRASIRSTRSGPNGSWRQLTGS